MTTNISSNASNPPLTSEATTQPTTGPLKYVMVSSEIRRDLEQPLSYFDRLEIHHLYNRAPWNDMKQGDFGHLTKRFFTPLSLYWHLHKIKPDIIQGPEPLSLLMFPFLVAVYIYLLLHPNVKLVTLSLEPIPLDKKYHPILVPMFQSVLTGWFKRASVIFWFDRGSYENLLRYGAPEETLVNQLYGSWGVDLDNFKPEGDKAFDNEIPTILYVGRLAKVKGVTYLLEAFDKLRHQGHLAKLAIVGDGAEREALEQQAKTSEFADDITFYGLIKNADLPPYMRAADIFALPSITSKLWVQQLSMTAWQAMACGLPVVTTDTGQMREFTPEGTGFLVEERNADVLAEALSKLVEDGTLRQSMSEAALAYAQDRFDTVKNVARAEDTILSRCGY
ncbi:MAG: glycosyltransferase [Deinococcota bacterium]